MLRFVMHANDSIIGAVEAWVSSNSPDFAGAGYPGPNDPVSIRCVATYDDGTASSVPADLIAAETFTLQGVISPTQLTASQTNDWNPTGLADAIRIRVTCDANTRQLTGISGGANGRVLVLHNTGSFHLTLIAESGSSSATNRFAFLGSYYLLAPNASAVLIYDNTTQRWRVLGQTVDANQIDDGNSSTAITVNFGLGPFHKITLTGNCTVTLTAPPRHRHVQLDWVQDATGGRTIAFSPTPKWVGGTTPTWATGANARNALTLFWNGTDWVGSGLTGLA